jgi:transforming growth factor-beta-induced protein
MKFLFSCITLLAALTFPYVQSQGYYTGDKGQYPSVGNIPTVLTENGLTTLVDAVVKAGLAETLSGPGPFTVFAPTNEAFSAIHPDVLKMILNNIALLTKVLTYHVVGSKVPPSAIKNELLLTTLQGEKVRINVYGKNGEIVTINGALRLKTLEASNGIIYVIDQVLEVPEPKNTIINVLKNNPAFTTLLTALNAAGLTSTLESEGPFTLLAPTNAAFRKLPPGALESLLANPEELKKVLLTHVIAGTVYSRGLTSGKVPVLSGRTVDVSVSNYGITVENARVIDPDISASNGVVHVIDAVILPGRY